MEPPLTVSLIHLIANPQVYDGKRVRLVGFLSLEFEGTCIFLHREDWEHRIYENGLWVRIRDGELTRERAKDLHLQYVHLEGTFRREVTGHLGALSNGGICEVTRFDLRQRFPDPGEIAIH